METTHHPALPSRYETWHACNRQHLISSPIYRQGTIEQENQKKIHCRVPPSPGSPNLIHLHVLCILVTVRSSSSSTAHLLLQLLLNLISILVSDTVSTAIAIHDVLTAIKSGLTGLHDAVAVESWVGGGLALLDLLEGLGAGDDVGEELELVVAAYGLS